MGDALATTAAIRRLRRSRPLVPVVILIALVLTGCQAFAPIPIAVPPVNVAGASDRDGSIAFVAASLLRLWHDLATPGSPQSGQLVTATPAPWPIPPSGSHANVPPASGATPPIGGTRPHPKPRPRPHPKPPSGHTTGSGSISVVSRGSRAHRWIALTFDDGWDAARCKTIERTLLAQHVTATWFPNAVYVRNAPALWRNIAANFPIGNHTRSHPDLTKLSSAAIRHQIVSDEKTIESVTGRPMLKMLRPPYGAYNSTVLRVAADLGYRDLILWNVDDRDTQGVNATQALADAERGTPGSIVLMHCGPAITPGILPSVISYYRARGFRFVTVPTLLRHG